MLELLIIVTLLFLFWKGKNSNTDPKSQYGSSQFSTNSSLLGRRNKGFIIGNYSLTKKESYKHAMLIAPSGGNKTQGIILKNVFHLAKHKYSLVINDPKLELHSLCSGWMRHSKKMNVYVLNLKEVQQSICWNPFQELRSSEYQNLITDMYNMTNIGVNTESIWRYGTIDLLTTVCKSINDSDQVLHLPNLLKTIKQLQAFPKETTQWLKKQTDDPETELSIDQIRNFDDKIFHGIVSGALSVVIPFTPDSLHPIQTKTTLPSILEFFNSSSALFLGLPIGKETTYAPYITLLLSHVFKQVVNYDKRKADLPLAFLMEEFAQLLPVPNYQNIISTIRGKAMILTCLQNMDQLNDRYGHSIAEIIANNSSNWILLPGIKSDRTLTYVRDSLLGMTTFHSHESDRINGRYLMTKDEIRRLNDETCLFIASNKLPTKMKLKPLYKSLFLKLQYSLYSENGFLKSKYPPIQHLNPISQKYLIDFSEKKYEELDLGFEEQLKMLLPTEEE